MPVEDITETSKILTTRRPVLSRRNWIMIAAILLFLPPLSFLFQLTQDSNFCGTWCPRMFFVWREGMTLNRFMMGFVRNYMGVALVFGILISTFFMSRYWCSHICPIGGVTELGSKLVPEKLKINYSGVPAPYFRYGYLAVFLIAPAVGIGSLCCSYCNFATIPRFFGAAFSTADFAYFLRSAGLINLVLVMALGFFAKGGRAYCNLLCPIGALDAVSNRIGAKTKTRVRVDSHKCTACRQCEEACPTWAITVNTAAEIDHLSCIPCRECEQNCSAGAITYEKNKK
ncbi:MAG: 4Fe-4S binding protein [Desulfobacterales bacterium]|nr:4Fe-4S binding protein [Desulfobacteraceae bacterium]MDH3829524.1 4Fe-4S binding protein [Desulfobacterales bacterium]